MIVSEPSPPSNVCSAFHLSSAYVIESLPEPVTVEPALEASLPTVNVRLPVAAEPSIARKDNDKI